MDELSRVHPLGPISTLATTLTLQERDRYALVFLLCLWGTTERCRSGFGVTSFTRLGGGVADSEWEQGSSEELIFDYLWREHLYIGSSVSIACGVMMRF